MTNEQLQEIIARHAAATPGEWYVSGSNVVETDDSFICGEGYQSWSADAEFIAHAHQDIPALIAEVEELWRMLKKIQNTALKACAYMEDIEDDPKEGWIGEFAAKARTLVERISDDIDEHEGGFK